MEEKKVPVHRKDPTAREAAENERKRMERDNSEDKERNRNRDERSHRGSES